MRRLRRQADRLQGGRPAARRLAAGQGGAPRRAARIAGFGEYEEGLRRLLAALERGDLDDAREVALAGWGLEGGEEKPLPILSAFLADPPAGYVEAAEAAAGSVEFIGRLEHDEVAELLPGAEALVMPSTFPEAFGMVAAEAAACGALPVSAGHSGMLEVVAAAAGGAARRRSARLTSFPVEAGAVEAIAERLERLAGAAGGRAGGGPRGAGRDRAAALELGGSGPRGARRVAGGWRAAAPEASAERHQSLKASRRRFNRMPAASCTAASR